MICSLLVTDAWIDRYYFVPRVDADNAFGKLNINDCITICRMFQDIRKFNQLSTTMLAVEISGQPSEDVGHLTPGLNWADANITCHDGYDYSACWHSVGSS